MRFLFRAARISAWVALAVVTGVLARQGDGRLEPLLGVRFQPDVRVRTADGRDISLDVYQPEGTGGVVGGKRPVLIAVHGGGWRGGSKSEYGRSLLPLVRQGYVVVAVDYRLSGPGLPSWPGNLEDVREAVRWVRNRSDVLEIDPERVAAIGASAGAHLALMLGSYSEANPSGVGAVVDFYGPTDLRSLGRKGSPTVEPVRLLLGHSLEVDPELYERASPILQLRDDSPPTLIVHGSDDTLVPPRQSRALSDAMEERGVPHEFLVLEGARHGFGLEVGGRDLTPEILSFLDSVWAREKRARNR